MTNIINGDLVKALAEFQRTVPLIPKERSATILTKTGGSYAYKYADLATINATIREALNGNGLSVSQTIGADGLTTLLMHVGGGVIESVIPLHLDGLDPQKQGSLITYLRRYAKCAILDIVADDDDDAAQVSGKNAVAPVLQTPQAAQPTTNHDAATAAAVQAIADATTLDALRTLTRKELDAAKVRGDADGYRTVTDTAIARAKVLKEGTLA